MTTGRQSEKLKKRLDQWQSYAMQSSEVTSARPTEADRMSASQQSPDVSYPSSPPSVKVVEDFALVHGGPEGQGYCGEHYEQEMARLEAELEKERAQAQEMAVKWGSEVLRRRNEAQNHKARLHPVPRTLVIETSKPPVRHASIVPQSLQQSQKRRRNYMPLIVLCLSVLLAGACSCIALHLEWSLGH